MPFPNFYVSSVDEKIVAVFKRSRMSLSHPDRPEQEFRYFHMRFMRPGCPVNGRSGTGEPPPPKTSKRPLEQSHHKSNFLALQTFNKP
jgi:hypothetical protein